jgi:hypothetical protein
MPGMLAHRFTTKDVYTGIYFLLSVALFQRLLRPRAKAASNCRCRCCHSRSSICIGDVRNDKKRILCYPLLARMNLRRTVAAKYSIVMCIALLEIQHVELNFRVTPIYCGPTYTHVYEQPTSSRRPHHQRLLPSNLRASYCPADERVLMQAPTKLESLPRCPGQSLLPTCSLPRCVVVTL